MSRNPRVLVAEDESIIALDIKNTLENWGFNVEATFRTGEELLDFAQKDDPEILIMDISLDGTMDGVEAASKVLEKNKIPVIFMTGETVPDKLSKLKLGVPFTYLKKPFSMAELKRALNNVYPDTPG